MGSLQGSWLPALHKGLASGIEGSACRDQGVHVGTCRAYTSRSSLHRQGKSKSTYIWYGLTATNTRTSSTDWVAVNPWQQIGGNLVSEHSSDCEAMGSYLSGHSDRRLACRRVFLVVFGHGT